MACRTEWTQTAHADVADIVGYMAEALRNPGAATSFLDQLEDRVAGIEANPLSCEFSRDPILRQRGYRRATLGSHLLLYTFDEQREAILTARVFYGGRDYARLV